ncbi:MAG: hypothetical protein E7290_02145 [Lachnospiraceae bacterium]|nr:hypothetical protein [Lachnospiraceae bacterium]
MAGKARTKPTFKYFVRINDGEPIDMDTLPKEKHDEIVQKLCDQFMAHLGYYPSKDQEAARKRFEEIERKERERAERMQQA